MRLFYGYVRSLDIDLIASLAQSCTPSNLSLLAAIEAAEKKEHPRYQQILNKHLGTPRPGTVGVNTSTALIGPGSTIRAVGAKLPRIHGASKAAARDYDRERGAYTDAMLGRGVAVKLTSAPVHESRGSGDLILIWLPHWVMDAAIPTFSPSAEVGRKLPPLPAKSTAILRLVPRQASSNGMAPPVQSTPLVMRFSARHQLVLSVVDGKGGHQDFSLDWTRGHVMPAAVERLVESWAKYAGVAPIEDVGLPSATLGSTITIADIKRWWTTQSG